MMVNGHSLLLIRPRVDVKKIYIAEIVFTGMKRTKTLYVSER